MRHKKGSDKKNHKKDWAPPNHVGRIRSNLKLEVILEVKKAQKQKIAKNRESFLTIFGKRSVTGESPETCIPKGAGNTVSRAVREKQILVHKKILKWAFRAKSSLLVTLPLRSLLCVVSQLSLTLCVFVLSRGVNEPGLELVGSQARTLFCQPAITRNPHSDSRAWKFDKKSKILSSMLKKWRLRIFYLLSVVR